MRRRVQAQALQAAEPFPGMADQLGDALADALPADPFLKGDGRGHGQPGTDVTRPLELQGAEARRRPELIRLVEPGALVVPTPADLQRLQPVLTAAAQVKEPRPVRRQEPFVTVAAVEVAADRLH